LPLDPQQADSQFLASAASNDLSPDRAFDREWAVALLERVVLRLREECVAEGRGGQFEVLRVFLTSGTGAESHASAGTKLGLAEGAVRVAVHRLRKRYRQLLRDEVAHTLAEGADVEAEMAALFGAFAR
jgi:RNA polymerase sigma-70 factor (ECF subfamily)